MATTVVTVFQVKLVDRILSQRLSGKELPKRVTCKAPLGPPPRFSV